MQDYIVINGKRYRSATSAEGGYGWIEKISDIDRPVVDAIRFVCGMLCAVCAAYEIVAIVARIP